MKGGWWKELLKEPRVDLGLLGGAWVVTIGASIITYIILGVPHYNYSIMGPQNPILIIKAPILEVGGGLSPRIWEFLKIRGTLFGSPW